MVRKIPLPNVGFMGGDGDPAAVDLLAKYVQECHNSLKVGILGAQQSLRSSINSISTISKWGLISAISVLSTLLAPISECTAAVPMAALRISPPAFGKPMKTRTYKKVVFA
mgnify:CR=1 FL=1